MVCGNNNQLAGIIDFAEIGRCIGAPPGGEIRHISYVNAAPYRLWIESVVRGLPQNFNSGNSIEITFLSFILNIFVSLVLI